VENWSKAERSSLWYVVYLKLTKLILSIKQTHNVALARPIASFVVAMKDGRIESQGTVADALSKDATLSKEAVKDQQAISRTTEEVDHQPPPDEPKGDGKLIAAEEIEEGHVSWPACRLPYIVVQILELTTVLQVKMYFSGMGGSYPWIFFFSVVGASLFTEIINSFETWFIGSYWSSQYNDRDPSEVPVTL